MELYFILTILDRDRQERMEKIYRDAGTKVTMSMLGRGTATLQHLSVRGLSPTEKTVLCTVADADTMRLLIRRAKAKLLIDIPGNGVLAAVPIKSVGGRKTLENFVDPARAGAGKPDMTFDHELICVVLNEGYSDMVMDAARPAGATGGTVVSAKGTGLHQSERFRGLSLTNERELLLIVAKSSVKADIMRSITEKAGLQSEAGAICFSLPVSQAAGLRELEED